MIKITFIFLLETTTGGTPPHTTTVGNDSTTSTPTTDTGQTHLKHAVTLIIFIIFGEI